MMGNFPTQARLWPDLACSRAPYSIPGTCSSPCWQPSMHVVVGRVHLWHPDQNVSRCRRQDRFPARRRARQAGDTV